MPTNSKSTIGINTELCLAEVILFMADKAAGRKDTATLDDLQDYVTQSYLALGYTTLDYIIGLREYVEALSKVAKGDLTLSHAGVQGLRRIIVEDMRDAIRDNGDAARSFQLTERGVKGLLGELR